MVMAHFEKADSHFVIFFLSDKSLETLSKDKIPDLDEVVNDGKCKALWPTGKITEDGRDAVEDMPYDGVIAFSGGKLSIFK